MVDLREVDAEADLDLDAEMRADLRGAVADADLETEVDDLLRRVDLRRRVDIDLEALAERSRPPETGQLYP